MTSLPPLLAAGLSLVVPGLGQWVMGRRTRGTLILFLVAVVAALLLLLDLPLFTWLALLPFWLMAAVDAHSLAARRSPNTPALLLLAALPIYAMGWQVTNIDVNRLLSNASRVRPLVAGLFQPQIVEQEREMAVAAHDLFVPCPAPAEIEPESIGTSARLAVSADCAASGDAIVVQGEGFPPNQSVAVWWVNTVGASSRLRVFDAYEDFRVDDEGRFTAEILVPPLQRSEEPRPHRVEARYIASFGSWNITQTAILVAQRMGETIAQALMATVIGALVAVPFSFFGARNLMAGNPALVVLYYISRTVMNVLRSIEPLIMAIVFVVWVGLGPFAGVLALMVHTIAALGKLYSESIESIDAGPVEAVRATGANQLQTIVYAVIPQVVPPWIAFTVYRWDINVRSSTIIGFVGGGGIGFLLAQWIRLQDFRAAGAAIWGIAVVVILLDTLSARVRERVL